MALYFNAFQSIQTAEQAQDNSLFLVHIKAFLGAVGSAVDSMSNPEQFIVIMEELGREHKVRRIDPDYLGVSLLH